MPKPDAVPAPSSWWEETTDARLVGSREQRLLACVDEAGRLHGPSTVFTAAGEPLIESQWRHGVLHGAQTIYKAPFFRTGQFHEGAPHGTWQLYWNQHALVSNTYEAGVVTSAARQNTLTRTISAKPVFLANDEPVASLEEALALGEELVSLGMSGWTEEALPEAVWACTSLRELKLYYSQLRPIPAGIGELENLELLEIKGCNIGSIDGAIGKLRKLRTLSVLESGLGIFPAVASPVLQHIDVSGNIMSRVGHSLAACEALTTLVMRDNYVMTLDENVFSAPALRRLDMTGSFWLGWISPAVGAASTLVNLTLYEQCLLALPDELSRCPELQTLNLFGAHLVQPPVALGARTISQLNLDGTPLHALPGQADFEARLQRVWAGSDETLAAHLAQEDLTLDVLGLTPPAHPAPLEPSGWTLGEDTHPLESFTALTSGDFGCEHGGYPVQVLTGAADGDTLPVAGLLRALGALRPIDRTAFRTLALQKQGSRLVEALEALAPTEAWQLEVLPEAAEDLKVALLVLQVDAGRWAAVGPSLAGAAEEPAQTGLRQLLWREIRRHGGAELAHQGLDREVAGPSTLVTGGSRAEALSRYLLACGACTEAPLDAPRLARRGQEALAQALAALGAPRQLRVAGVAVSRHCWLGRREDRWVGLTTRTVAT